MTVAGRRNRNMRGSEPNTPAKYRIRMRFRWRGTALPASLAYRMQSREDEKKPAVTTSPQAF
jgi:hypothetical protein